MKIKLVFEKDDKVCEVKISKKMLRDIYDMAWHCLDSKDFIEENDIDISSIIKKLQNNG